jgi:uncharacterized membrane protein YgcG
MTSDTLFDALEICLQALDLGADVESCLVRYPALADELRPILMAAVQARAAAVTEVPADVTRRGRARVLQAAAEMREQPSVAPVLPFWRKKGFFGARFYRLAVTTALVITFLLTGGTGLVNASSGALPGDNLYPVKRGWEGLQLVFVFDERVKEELEHKFDIEREHEIEELYSEKRMEQVNFQGVIQSQQNDLWIIDGLKVAIESETVYVGEIMIGSTVQVIGKTDDGIIEAKRIILVAAPGTPPALIPTFAPPPTAVPEMTSAPEEKPESVDDSSESGPKETEPKDKLDSKKDDGSDSGDSSSEGGDEKNGGDSSGESGGED